MDMLPGSCRRCSTRPTLRSSGLYEPDAERRAEVERGEGPFARVRWFDSEEELLADRSIIAVASEGENIESLPQTEALVDAGMHVWYDKPAARIGRVGNA